VTAPVHLCPPPTGTTPCCGLAAHEIPGTDRVTTFPALATCQPTDTEESPMDSTVDPQPGRCRVEAWTMRDGTFVDKDSRILGEMTWADLITQVAEQGGTRPTYDLFDVPNPDGTTTRYRAIDIHEEQQ
jgi:hypothetical protein